MARGSRSISGRFWLASCTVRCRIRLFSHRCGWTLRFIHSCGRTVQTSTPRRSTTGRSSLTNSPRVRVPGLRRQHSADTAHACLIRACRCGSRRPVALIVTTSQPPRREHRRGGRRTCCAPSSFQGITRGGGWGGGASPRANPARPAAPDPCPVTATMHGHRRSRCCASEPSERNFQNFHKRSRPQITTSSYPPIDHTAFNEAIPPQGG